MAADVLVEATGDVAEVVTAEQHQDSIDIVSDGNENGHQNTPIIGESVRLSVCLSKIAYFGLTVKQIAACGVRISREKPSKIEVLVLFSHRAHFFLPLNEGID